MKRFFDLIIRFEFFVRRETWWRWHYKRVTLSDKQANEGKCLYCHAGAPPKESLRCDMMKGRDCPCKMNQCLKLKGENWV